MSNLYYSSLYKSKIMNILLGSKDLIKLINPDLNSDGYKSGYLDVADILTGGVWYDGTRKYEEQGYIFDYNFVNETTTDEKTFILVETDIEYVRQNMFTDFNLYISIFTSKSLVRLTNDTVPTAKEVNDMGYFASNNANRIDVMCDIVDGLLNGNIKIPGIGTVNPASRYFVQTYCPNNKYYGKCLKYTVTNLNEIEEFCENK